MTPAPTTRERILDAALDAFGTRGVGAVSLDEIAKSVGVRKQTLLYWFPSKDALLGGVVARTAEQLGDVVEAAARRASVGFAGVEAVVKGVFRPAIRRPALLGLVREIQRIEPGAEDPMWSALAPYVQRGIEWLQREMDAGRLRRADPGLTVALMYATVVGVASEPAVLRLVGWQPTPGGLRRLRAELLDFLRSALVRPAPEQ